jgi:murein DD-endopeptidase MepM/ murein hydrolase activator NlpD
MRNPVHRSSSAQRLLTFLADQPIWEVIWKSFLKLPGHIQIAIVLVLIGVGTVRSSVQHYQSSLTGTDDDAQAQAVPGNKALKSKPGLNNIKGVNPVPGGVLTEWQRVRKESPVTGGPTDYCHNGLDIAAATGSPIVAFRDGVVAYADWSDVGYGYLVIIDHLDGVYSAYGHNQGLLVKSGDRVKAGQAIAKLGSTGYSSGPHLHFFLMAGKQIGNYRPGQSLPVNYLVHQLPIPDDSRSGQPRDECSRDTPKVLALAKNNAN